MATIEDVLALAKYSEPVTGKKDTYICSCINPAHFDKTPSLAIKKVIDKVTGEENVLLYCFGGCLTDELFKILNGQPLINPTISRKILEKMARGERYDNNYIKEEYRIVKTYNYLNLDESLRFQKIRYEPKKFAYRKPATAEIKEKYGLDWIYKDVFKDISHQLYKIDIMTTLKDKKCEIIIDESEKNVEYLLQEGYIATCPSNTNVWGDEWNQYFKGKDVILIPHNDAKGVEFNLKIFSEIAVDVNSLKIINLEVSDSKDDLLDWIEKSNGTLEKFNDLISAAEDMKNFPLNAVESHLRARQQPEIKVESDSVPEEKPKSRISEIPLLTEKEYENTLCSMCFNTGFQSTMIDGKVFIKTNYTEDSEMPELIPCNHQTFTKAISENSFEQEEDSEEELGF